MKTLRLTSWIAPATACLLGLGMAPRAHGDFVTDWNQQALNALQSQGLSSPYASRNLATMHIAIYNAIQTISPTYQVYSHGSYVAPDKGSAPLGADIYAAATTAAYTVMQSLYPTLGNPGGVLETQYNAHLGTITNGQSKTDGIAWGTSIANDILAWRSTDGASGAQTPYTPAGTLGHWVTTDTGVPPADQPLLPSWGSVTPFTLSNVGALTPAGLGPDLLTHLASSNYATDYNQVKSLGALNGSTRTTDQTEIANFWNAGAGTVTTAGMWNQIAQSIANDGVYGNNFSMEENSRLFAALNVALADASIVTWNAKYETDFWRPDTAIAYGGDMFVDSDGNPLTEGDENWEPLLTTPLSPEYISEHSSYSAAAASILANFFGNNVNFTHQSDIYGNGSVILERDYTSFSGAADEAGLSRIYAGANFGKSDTDGQRVGEDVGAIVMGSQFALVPEPGSALLVMCAGFSLMLRRRTRV